MLASIFRIPALIVCLVALLAPPAGAATPTVDLATVEGIESYLVSIGVDPSDAVWQTGTQNYAGPECPGEGWTCTGTARPVVQLAPSGGENRYECGGGECTVVQSGGESSQGECNENIKTGDPDVSQSCTIAQSGPANKAMVLQVSHQDTGQTQSALQEASITQSAPSGGSNEAHVVQSVTQQAKANASGDVTQTQDAEQRVAIDQDGEGSASNSALVDQSQNQDAFATTDASIVQRQNVREGADEDVLIDQTSGTGTNTAKLKQSTKQHGKATSTPGPVDQRQGIESGGLEGQIHQNSEGLSTATANQSEQQKLEGNTGGMLTQEQQGPQGCCSDQQSNANNTFDITQFSEQTASAGALQRTLLNGRCATSGNCEVSQTAVQNGETVTNECSGQVCDDTTLCVNAECQAGPSEPVSSATAGVRNESAGETGYATETAAEAGDTLGYRYDYANTGNAAAEGATLTTTIPTQTSFVACSGGCTVTAGTVTWSLGDVAPGGTASVTLTVAIQSPLIDPTTGAPLLDAEIRNAVTADTAQEDPVTSNETLVVVEGLLPIE